MARIPIAGLSRYLLEGYFSPRGCLSTRRLAASRTPRTNHSTASLGSSRTLHTSAEPPPSNEDVIPVRKKLKDEIKRQKAEKRNTKSKIDNQTVPGWELTVGIEIHAQINTSRKLFSPAATSFNEEPNSHVAVFDLSMPGAQPVFQIETLIPALRAALALNCQIQPVSQFDRKHYFWWDQPAGYQITQYYEPFARNGQVRLLARDGIAAEDGAEVDVRIKQVQLEQDTGKTLAQPGDVHWLDFNRVGMPLIEIITEPDIHHPRTAAVFVKKVQALLGSVDACVSGMEVGGMRADVNVSVRRVADPTAPLGTRTEIKNLGSIKAVEDAIIAERDRQIAELDRGRTILGETRGWTLGSKETRRLRGKEGEVDYRYMPDPDLGPLFISQDLVSRLRETVTVTPDAEVDRLVSEFGLTAKDAASLMALEDGRRVEYFYNVVDELGARLNKNGSTTKLKEYSTLAGNWILHELGKLTMQRGDENNLLTMSPDGQCSEVPVKDLAELLSLLAANCITGRVAKQLLVALYVGEVRGAGGLITTIDTHNLWFHELSDDEYDALADSILEGEDKVLSEFKKSRDRYPQGKLMFLVGKMMKKGATERINARKAEAVLREKIGALCREDAS